MQIAHFRPKHSRVEIVSSSFAVITAMRGPQERKRTAMWWVIFLFLWPQQQSIIFYGAFGLRDFLFQNRKRENSNCTSFRPKELPTSIHLKIVKSPKCFLYLLRFHQILISFVLLCLLGRMNGGASLVHTKHFYLSTALSMAWLNRKWWDKKIVRLSFFFPFRSLAVFLIKYE